MPVWDAGAGELRYRGQVVKRFRNAGSNQRCVLDAFQRLGWPRHILDPLPANRGINSKQRLHDTIKNLNRCHESECLIFYGLDAGHAGEMGYLTRRRLETALIRTDEADVRYNCHGFVFTGGRYWIRGGYVEHILKDNGYSTSWFSCSHSAW